MEITVKRSQSGCGGLGFTIAGGVDTPIEESDPGVYITKIVDGGAAQAAGIRFGDRLLTMNGSDLTEVTHADAIAALTSFGAEMVLQIARLPLGEEAGEHIMQIEFGRAVGAGIGLSERRRRCGRPAAVRR